MTSVGFAPCSRGMSGTVAAIDSTASSASWNR